MLIKYYLLFAGLSLGLFACKFKAHGQDIKKWEKEMKVFEEQDKVNPPPKHPIVFAGSSSIVKWQNLGSYFPDKPVINRGFGGSKTDEVIYYADKAILSYKPKQVVIYVGDNDIAAGRSPERVLADLKELFRRIREESPRATITYLSIKPSPSRIKYITEIKRTNELVKAYLSSLRNTDYVDVFNPMLGSSGRPEPKYFGSDSLHMTATGYDLWKNILTKYIR